MPTPTNTHINKIVVGATIGRPYIYIDKLQHEAQNTNSVLFFPVQLKAFKKSILFLENLQ